MKELEFQAVGLVCEITGFNIKVKNIRAPIGARCKVYSQDDYILADVVCFDDSSITIMPLGDVGGIKHGDLVEVVDQKPTINISDNLMGCVIDPKGEVISGTTQHTNYSHKISIANQPPRINQREGITTEFNTGIKAIDSMFTIGYGQRIGLFAGTGVGKSYLLSMVTKFSSADVVVIGLIGERGREVTEFINETLDEEALAKSIIVASPADDSPILRMQGAEVATAIAEHYRDKGKSVLLLIDSITRYAQAHREVALSSGETPVNKGYPASVFAKLPKLIERAGNVKGDGCITAIYTVLVEGDDLNDPISDATRGVLDGHIVLSREIASRGIYPAIDVPVSISRLTNSLVSPDIQKEINEIKSLFSIIRDNFELINLGLVEKGKNKALDLAIEHQDLLNEIVSQNYNDQFTIEESRSALREIHNKIKKGASH